MPIASDRIAVDTKDSNNGTSRRRAADMLQTIAGPVRIILVAASQLLGLWGLYFVGVWLVGVLHLPVPGNLMGLIALYVLLSIGIVKISWFDPLGSWLIKHLAFFFIPVTVGLMDAAGFLLSHAVAIAVALIASAATGILLAGFISQVLVDKTPRAGGGL